MRPPMIPALRKTLIGLAAVCAALSATGRGTLHTPGQKSPDLAPNAGRDAYQQIVQLECVTNWLQHHDPSPCERVFLADAKTGSTGYALLADPEGGTHYLLVPTQTMTSTDNGELLDPNLPNYFAEAWGGRDLLSKLVGHDVPRTDVGLVVATAAARTQNQFHIHIECLRKDVVDSLKATADKVTDVWSPLTVAGFPFHAVRLSVQGLEASNPFELVANLSPDARHHLGSYTVVIAGMQYQSGPGFIVLTGTGPSGDLLLDSGCTVAGGGGCPGISRSVAAARPTDASVQGARAIHVVFKILRVQRETPLHPVSDPHDGPHGLVDDSRFVIDQGLEIAAPQAQHFGGARRDERRIARLIVHERELTDKVAGFEAVQLLRPAFAFLDDTNLPSYDDMQQCVARALGQEHLTVLQRLQDDELSKDAALGRRKLGSERAASQGGNRGVHGVRSRDHDR